MYVCCVVELLHIKSESMIDQNQKDGKRDISTTKKHVALTFYNHKMKVLSMKKDVLEELTSVS